MLDYNNIAFLPIDLPLIPKKEKIIDAFNAYENEFVYGWWDAFRMFEPTKDFEPTDKWSSYANTLFPELRDWMTEHLPYSAHIHAKLMKARVPAQTHIDYQDPSRRPDVYRHLQENEPASYRLFITGARQNGVYVCKDKDSLSNNFIYPVLPESTDVYVMPYTTQYHGINFDPNRIVMITNGYIDISRHKLLLEKSYEKYRDYIVWRSDLK